MSKRYLISEEELLNLLSDSIELRALARGGVDNWEWYSYSCQDFIQDFVQDYIRKNPKEWNEEFEEFSFEDIAKIDLQNNYIEV